jgi:GNAT superfamily N-acetyltransferase
MCLPDVCRRLAVGERFSRARPLTPATSVKVETLFEYILEAEFAVLSSASEVRRRPWGAILVAADYPAVHEANLAWVDAVPPGGISRVILELDGAMRAQGISFRRLEFSDPKTAHAVQGTLVDLGFRPARAVAMVRLGDAPSFRNLDLEVREVDTPEEREVFDAVLEELHRERGADAEASKAALEWYRERAAALGERAYMGLFGGEAAGIASLVPRPKLGLIAEVGTRPEHRKKGVARSLVEVVSDRSQALGLPYTGVIGPWYNEAARDLYASLGYQPVGEVRGFHKG